VISGDGRPAGSVYTQVSDSTRGRGTLPDAHPEPAREIHAVASTKMRLATTREGGFRIDTGGGDAPLVADPEGEGWEVRQGPDGPRWKLTRDGSYPGGFLLRGSQGGGPARTTREAACEGPPSNLLAPDGRLFRVVRRGAAVTRFELTGWEVPGAYLVAHPDESGFEIARTDAGRELDLAAEILILFAAEIVEAVSADARG